MPTDPSNPFKLDINIIPEIHKIILCENNLLHNQPIKIPNMKESKIPKIYPEVAKPSAKGP